MMDCRHDEISGSFYPNVEFLTLVCRQCGKEFGGFKDFMPKGKKQFDDKILEEFK